MYDNAHIDISEDKDRYIKNLFLNDFSKTVFPYNYIHDDNDSVIKNKFIFSINETLYQDIMQLSDYSNDKLNLVLIVIITIILKKHTQSSDIVFGIPVKKESQQSDSDNNYLVIRNQVKENLLFKDLMVQLEGIISDATMYQKDPLDLIIKNVGSIEFEEDFQPVDIMIILENIHDKFSTVGNKTNLNFIFHNTGSSIEATVEFNHSYYKEATIKRIENYFITALNNILTYPGKTIEDIEILSINEINQLLFEFNNTFSDYPSNKTIQSIFEEQVNATPDNVAVIFENEQLTYKELNERSNQIAGILKKNGVKSEKVVGVMMGRSIDMVICLLGIIKAGGSFLPIDIDFPTERILYMLKNSDAKVLLTKSKFIQDISYCSLQNFEDTENIEIVVTQPRSYIRNFDDLPMPDRSYINFKKYKNTISMASITDSISIQATRGCPYHCIYCHKVWPKNHTYRSADKLFAEVEYYYKRGVRNFSIIDDIFNLNNKNSRRFFELILKNKLDLNIYFPNGLRGDILTEDYIDLMIEAGTRLINLSLETASLRLQKLLKKDLNVEKLRHSLNYIAAKYPHVILELASMHGFPTETEKEAMMTLDFIKSIKWLHFPYIHILKIYPNTEMEAFALSHGVRKEDILSSKNLAYHELPETLPFPKSFTRQYQANYMNEYFLSKDRLKHTIPVQINIMSERALINKYDNYLPARIEKIQDILDLAHLEKKDIYSLSKKQHVPQNDTTMFDQEQIIKTESTGGKRILLLDLSLHFSSYTMLYKVVEQPLGLLYLLTYLKEKLGDKINGKVFKSGVDFDNFETLKEILDDYKPDIIGIRTLTFFKDFFHETVSMLRQWGYKNPVIAGGPYATSDYDSILKDKNVDMVILGEGEHTFTEVVEEMFKNGFQTPAPEVLKNIKGIAYCKFNQIKDDNTRCIIPIDNLADSIKKESRLNPEPDTKGHNLAYVMYTSGSTGKPKGVMVEHRQIINCIFWMKDKFRLNQSDTVVQRTNLTFDPSVWEIFLPLFIGARVKILGFYNSKNPEYLLKLMSDKDAATMMYCPASLINGLTQVINSKSIKPELNLPWLITGAEPISKDVVNNLLPHYYGKLVNTYGPTECTINNTYYDIVDANISSIPIGKPVSNNKIYILSNNLKLIPINTPGEICIAGNSIARGYINDTEKTKKSFIKNPFENNILYKTGDIGKWLDNGNIEIMGRIDDQIKLRGYRIELEEINNVIRSHPHIIDSTVIVSDSRELQKNQVSVCKKCGITTKYPGADINEDGVCDICNSLYKYSDIIDNYFAPDLIALKDLIKKGKKGKSSYDCVLKFGGGIGSIYALFQLTQLGLNVLTMTFQNGYFTKSHIDNIKKITEKLGADNIVVEHNNSDDILKESLKSTDSLCAGCIQTSNILAMEYAYKNGINAVFGCTFSHGAQIIVNGLYDLMKQGITEIDDIENKLFNKQKNLPVLNKNLFSLIDPEMGDKLYGDIVENVRYLDFYRFCDVTNDDIISCLKKNDLYTESKNPTAIYSSRCSIKLINDYHFMLKKGYHFLGRAGSWEKRLDLISLNGLTRDLKCNISHNAYVSFFNKIGYDVNSDVNNNDAYLCAYLVLNSELDNKDVREHLLKKLPDYMIPKIFMRIDKIPLTINGKVDKTALPNPKLQSETEGLEPIDKIEEEVLALIVENLKLDSRKINMNDNYFNLGGDSIRLALLIYKILENQLNISGDDINNFNDWGKILETPTPKGFSDYIKSQQLK